MVRFVDLETGNTFDGSGPYIFWFNGEQGINMFYTQPICFISEQSKIRVSLNSNDIFKLIDSSKLDENRGGNEQRFNYLDIQNLICDEELILTGHEYQGYYIYLMYILGSSPQIGEYIEEFHIENETYRIGADFYDANEALYVNLSNMGMDIPESIQKALYGVNVHEDKTDHITLNRKWKELLSNYWDMIANKGSYKSLYNCLKWFEYGDSVKLYELWKCKEKYEIRDIQEILENKYEESISNFSKTTYEALHLSLEEIKHSNGNVVYDSEGNPELQPIISKWSKEDLSLKMCMLGNFYETYFMPIHLDLIHSTIENIVYSNTFKLFGGSCLGRNDYVYNTNDFSCNVQNGDIFKLGNVECYVGPSTVFKTDTNNTEWPIIVGVQKNIPKFDNPDDLKLRTYLTQLYRDVGSIVDFEIRLPLSTSDSIKRSTIWMQTYNQSGQPVNHNLSIPL